MILEKAADQFASYFLWRLPAALVWSNQKNTWYASNGQFRNKRIVKLNNILG